MPVRTPGSITTSGTSNQTCAISLIAEVTSGTEEETAMPVHAGAGRGACEFEADQPQQLGDEQGVLVSRAFERRSRCASGAADP